MESTITWYLYGETGQTLVPMNQDSVQKNRLRTSQTLKHKLRTVQDQRCISHVLHPKKPWREHGGSNWWNYLAAKYLSRFVWPSSPTPAGPAMLHPLQDPFIVLLSKLLPQVSCLLQFIHSKHSSSSCFGHQPWVSREFTRIDLPLHSSPLLLARKSWASAVLLCPTGN